MRNESSKDMQVCRVVGGRVVNGYSRSDWLLRFLYRTMSVQMTIAGIGPVRPKDCNNIVNIDLSHIVSATLFLSNTYFNVLGLLCSVN